VRGEQTDILETRIALTPKTWDDSKPSQTAFCASQSTTNPYITDIAT
jgi:hypothetical protein